MARQVNALARGGLEQMEREGLLAGIGNADRYLLEHRLSKFYAGLEAGNRKANGALSQVLNHAGEFSFPANPAIWTNEFLLSPLFPTSEQMQATLLLAYQKWEPAVAFSLISDQPGGLRKKMRDAGFEWGVDARGLVQIRENAEARELASSEGRNQEEGAEIHPLAVSTLLAHQLRGDDSRLIGRASRLLFTIGRVEARINANLRPLLGAGGVLQVPSNQAILDPGFILSPSFPSGETEICHLALVYKRTATTFEQGLYSDQAGGQRKIATLRGLSYQMSEAGQSVFSSSEGKPSSRVVGMARVVTPTELESARNEEIEGEGTKRQLSDTELLSGVVKFLAEQTDWVAGEGAVVEGVLTVLGSKDEHNLAALAGLLSSPILEKTGLVTYGEGQQLELTELAAELLGNRDLDYLLSFGLEACEAAAEESRQTGRIPRYLPGDVEITEGAISESLQRKRSRSQNLKQYAIELWARESNGKIACAGCGDELSQKYGEERGAGLIEADHIRPLRDYAQEGETRSRREAVKNLCPLCPNCHAAIDRKGRGDKLSLAELQALIAATREGIGAPTLEPNAPLVVEPRTPWPSSVNSREEDLAPRFTRVRPVSPPPLEDLGQANSGATWNADLASKRGWPEFSACSTHSLPRQTCPDCRSGVFASPDEVGRTQAKALLVKSGISGPEVGGRGL